MSQLNVLYQSSSLYVIPAAVSICSLFENNKDIKDIHIWYINDGLTEEDKQNLIKLSDRYNRRLSFIDPTEIEVFLSQNGVEKWNGAYATFYKLFICNEIEDVDRLIYIDSDTIINGSLKELIDYDLEGYACGMVASAMSKEYRDYLGVDPYFNGGFEVYNMDYWKNNNVSDLLIKNVNDIEKRFKYTIIADESLINISLQGKIKKLPLKYDCEATWWLWGTDRGVRKKLGWNVNEGFYSIQEVKEAYKNPVIMHYMDLTTGRPWDYLNDHPFKDDYLKYLDILKPWKELHLANKGLGGNSKLLLRGKWLIKKIMPMYIRRRLGYIQHNNACKVLISKVQEKTLLVD